MRPPIIYNLFPRLVGPTTRWGDHVRRAVGMGFGWIYLNPWHYPGFSGSLYAPKEFYRLNPLFLAPGAEETSLAPLRDFLAVAREAGAAVIMDLIVNHTSKDCPLSVEHPTWYRRDARGELVSPRAVDPNDPGNVTVWGDLAEVDNDGSPDRAGLWNFWGDLVEHSLGLGFSGFRCDAAYMVPSELWRYLIDRARSVAPEVVFFAETLGAAEEQVLALRDAGFDYLFNSSKWWNFTDPWAIEQHERFGRIAPSISFPETHDTARLADESEGDEAVQRQRYAFAAAFSAGVMMPIGYEFGFRRRMNVVHTMPSDWERRHFDLTTFVRNVNEVKVENPLLHGEGRIAPLVPLHDPVLVLERRVDADPRRAVVLVNKDPAAAREVDLGTLDDRAGLRLVRICRDGARPEPVPDRLALDRAEVAYLLPETTGFPVRDDRSAE